LRATKEITFTLVVTSRHEHFAGRAGLKKFQLFWVKKIPSMIIPPTGQVGLDFIILGLGRVAHTVYGLK